MSQQIQLPLSFSDDAQVYVRIKQGDSELELKGPASFVQPLVEKAFFRGIPAPNVVSDVAKPTPERLTLSTKTNAPSLADDSAFVEQEEIQPENAENLAQVYRKTFAESEPSNQHVLLSFITHFYNEHLQREFLVLDDYREAFRELKREAVEEPEDIRSSLKNARTAKYLYSPEAGKFGLTSKGERLLGL